MISVTFYIYRNDEEIEIEIYAKLDPGERATMYHPGDGPEATYCYAEYHGIKIDLTSEEIKKVQEALDSSVQDGMFE